MKMNQYIQTLNNFTNSVVDMRAYPENGFQLEACIKHCNETCDNEENRLNVDHELLGQDQKFTMNRYLFVSGIRNKICEYTFNGIVNPSDNILDDYEIGFTILNNLNTNHNVIVLSEI
eukprot:131533_1